MEQKPLKAIQIVRVSSTKQGLVGDSLDQQEKQIESAIARLSNTYNRKIIIDKEFEFTESASVTQDLQPLLKAIEYCKQKNEIKFAFIKSIDRVTRAGSGVYNFLKSEFAKYGVVLVDTYGIINSETANTLSHLGIEYDWSKYSPSWITELLEAERAKSEVRDILSRMIGAEIQYVRMGYRVRPSPPGYQNKKVETPHGMRVILEPHPSEAYWFIKMFELKAQGNLSDLQIVEEVNKLGFKSRRTRKRDKNDKTKVIGYGGERPLTIKQLQRYIQNPIYAGINTEKWTNGTPIKEKYEGLISIDLFNKANRNKITIIEADGQIEIIKGRPKLWQLRKNKENPLYPFKQYVLCPTCKKTLLGSASRGKSGRYFPAYHCGRGHYFRVSMPVFEETVGKFVKSIKFSEDFRLKFEQIVLEEWEKREKQLSKDTITVGEKVLQIEQEIQLAKEKLKQLSSPTTIKLFEEDIDKLQIEKLNLTVTRDNAEEKQLDVQMLINYTRYFMEHLEDLILNSHDLRQNACMFGLIFEETPTYKDLINGTPKLAPLFKLNEEFNKTKELSVTPRGFEPR